jgi:pyruvate dehydrogenase E2 component (dihydrolipoamide acetyltransferase)
MESGSIAKWNVKEGDRFEPGVSLCDVETDKATVSFDATDEGYLAKILVGAGDIKVGQPLIVTVDEASDVAAFKDFKLEGLTVSSSAPKSPPPAAPSVASIAAPAATNVQSTTTTESHSKIFASPLARKLIRESNTSLQLVQQAIGGHGSGPRGRITADDVLKAAALPKPVAVVPPTTLTAATTSSQGATKASPSVTKSTISTAGVYKDFQVNEISKQLAAQYVHAKQSVPHYHVSVEINVGELLKLRQQFNSNLSKDKKGAKAATDDASNGLSVFDFLVKAAAVATQLVS